MKKIILDTNFLIYCIQFKIDIVSEIDRVCFFPYKLAIIDKTLNELEKVKPKELNLIKIFVEKLEIIRTEETKVDLALINLSKECIVATQDKELKRSLRGPVLVIRQKKYFQLLNY